MRINPCTECGRYIETAGDHKLDCSQRQGTFLREEPEPTYRGKTAQWWAEACDTLDRSNGTAQARLAAIRILVSKRETAAVESLARMYGGEPFPAIVSTGELRVLLDEPLP